LLESWVSFEEEHGDESSLNAAKEKCPKAVKKRRRVLDENGEPTGWEEYFDYIFPEDGDDQSQLKLLELAHAWKNKIAEEEEESEGESEEESEDED
jgi:crooked neck